MRALKTTIVRFLAGILPERAKLAVFHLGFQLAPREFEKFAHEYAHAPNMKFGLVELAKKGLHPKSIVDVGAFEGTWSKLAKEIWPNSHLYMIEPNSKKKAKIEEVGIELGARVFFDVLGAEQGREVQFYVMESGSSVMGERSPLQRMIERRHLQTLDHLLRDIEPGSLLKIDAQGYELEILKGASAILPCFDAVLLEVSIIEINEGAPLLHDVVAHLKALGFVVYDIFEIHRRPLDRALNQVDLLFVREQSPLIADKRHFG